LGEICARSRMEGGMSSTVYHRAKAADAEIVIEIKD
jgi:hypothetical protein